MRRYKITFVLALSILLGCVCSAQQTPTTSVPNLIRYSASLKDGQGATLPPNTPVGVTFAIYKQQDGGAPVWQETQNVTPDAAGQYTVLLGTTTSTGLPDDLFSQQEQRWLGIQLQGEAEQPRVMMVSVPYAFKAHEAETLGGLPASAFMKAPPSDGAGGNYVGGTAGTTQTASGASNGAGDKAKSGGGGPDTVVNCTTAKNNYLPIFTAAAPPNITICNSVVYQAGSNIGIGTITPVATLDVNGAINTSQYYQILGTTVLAIPGYTSGTENLSVGAGTGGTLSKTGNLPPTLTGTNDTFVGYQAGTSTTSGSYDTFLGDEAGIFNTTGSQNTYTGYTAGYGNTTGIQNSCYGVAACLHNLTGNENVAVGVGAGFRNTVGSNNTYVGFDTGWGNTIGDLGSNNTMMGWEAGFGNTASNGSFYGYKAGYSNTANSNSFFGYSAGTANTTGDSNTFLGNVAGTATTTGAGNTFVGDAAGTSNVTGSNNTFTGQNAGKANTADGNSFYGFEAGVSNTTGAQNTFVGISAGSSNTTGGGNTYVGWKAGFASAPGTGTCCNTIVGNGAGYGVNGPMTAGGNSFFGHRAGEGTTSGGKNVFSGFWSGLVNQTGSFNSFYGDQSGQSMTSGDYNTFLGISTAGSFTNGDYNTFVGAFAGNSSITGSSNIYVGNAGTSENNTIRIGMRGSGTGQQNMVFFDPILENHTALTQVVTIGNDGKLGYNTISGGGGNVSGNCTDPSTGVYLTNWVGSGTSMTVGCSFLFQQNTTNFIGIGTTTPARQLDVSGEVNASHYEIGDKIVVSIDGTDNTLIGDGPSNATGTENTIVGKLAGAQNTGSNNAFQGFEAGVNNKAGGQNTFLGAYAGLNNVSGNGNTFVGYDTGNAFSGGSGNIFIGSSTANNNTTSSNDIYLGNSDCGYPCTESGVIRLGSQIVQTSAYIAGIYNSTSSSGIPVYINSSGQLGTMTSSLRFKQQVRDMGDSTDLLLKLRPVTFFYKPEYENGPRTLQYGLIAEEVAKVYPDLVAYGEDGKPYTVRYQYLAPMLLNELQKEHKVVMAQQEQLQTQLQRIDAQRQEIDGLKRQLQLQNASLQERLSKLESYVETQIKAASDNAPRTALAANGGLQ